MDAPETATLDSPSPKYLRYDAPEIDGEVYIDGGYDVEVGDIVKVNVVQSDIYDLYAELV